MRRAVGDDDPEGERYGGRDQLDDERSLASPGPGVGREGLLVRHASGRSR